MSRRKLTILLVVLTLLVPYTLGVFVSAAERGYSLGGTREVFLAIGRFPVMVQKTFRQLRMGSGQVIRNKFGTCGVHVDDSEFNDSNYVLVSAYDPELSQSLIRLVRIADGEVMHSWVPPVDQVGFNFEPPFPGAEKTTPNRRFFHPKLMSDGSILFTGLPGPMVKLNRDGNITWVVQGVFHHSIELDAEGNIWTCGNLLSSQYDSLTTPDVFEDNAVTKISPAGEILLMKSVPDILEENHLGGLLLGAGTLEQDPLHLNDVQPALTDGPFWKKGDVLVSLRNISMVFLYRPSSDSVVWYRFGNWINQHDVDFVDSTHISVFGNDRVRIEYGGDIMLNGYNDYYCVDLRTGEVTTPYNTVFSANGICTKSEGLAEAIGGGRILIGDSNNGRLVIADKDKVLWTYTQCTGENTLSMLSWSRYITKDRVTFLSEDREGQSSGGQL